MKTNKYIYAVLLITIFIFAYSNNAYIESTVLVNIVFLENFYLQNPIYFTVLFFLFYILLTTLSLPVALLLGLLSGFIFEIHTAVIIVSFASTVGATLAMLVSRYFIKDFIKNKYSDQVSIVNTELDKYGSYYLFALRMSPIFPFFVINVIFGLTNMRVIYFYVISQLGMLPATYAIIAIGSELNKAMVHGASLSIDLIFYLTLLGVLPLIFKKYTRRNSVDHP
tara:strand:+ start:449 stop:1120 length:672 start_codon:yes stop_codon:yes gene_type:complete